MAVTKYWRRSHYSRDEGFALRPQFEGIAHQDLSRLWQDLEGANHIPVSVRKQRAGGVVKTQGLPASKLHPVRSLLQVLQLFKTAPPPGGPVLKHICCGCGRVGGGGVRVWGLLISKPQHSVLFCYYTVVTECCPPFWLLLRCVPQGANLQDLFHAERGGTPTWVYNRNFRMFSPRVLTPLG